MKNLLRALKKIKQVNSLASYIFTIFHLNISYYFTILLFYYFTILLFLVPQEIVAYLKKVLEKLTNHHKATHKDYFHDVEPFRLGFGLVLSKHLKSILNEAAPSESVNMFVYEGMYFTCNLFYLYRRF